MKLKLLSILVVLIGISCAGLLILQFHWLNLNIQTEIVKFKISISTSATIAAMKLSGKEWTRVSMEKCAAIDSNTKRALISGKLNHHPITPHPAFYFDSIPKMRNTVRPENTYYEIRIFPSSFFSDTTAQIISKMQQFDSLLSRELMETGIYYPYSIALYNSEIKKFTFISNPTDSAELLHSKYSFGIVSEKNQQSKLSLHIYFPSEDKYLFFQISHFLWISILFVIVTSIASIFTLKYFFKQRKLSDIKNDFINNITHEIKTPIAIISLASEALRDSTIPHEAELKNKFLTIIIEENKRLNNLVSQILQQANQDKNPANLIKKDLININETLESCSNSFRSCIEEKEGLLQLELKATNPFIKGDETLFINLIYNLLDNAFKYSPVKPIITIATKDLLNAVEIKIKDNGIGISKKDHKRIFEKFHRVSTKDIHNVKGFGVGLSFASYATTSHGGRIEVDSKPNKGSTFTIVLPRE